MKRYVFVRVLFGTIAAVLLAAPAAQAALGEAADSVTTDQRALSAPKVTTKAPSSVYSVQEVTSDVVSVREYVSPSGIVFALAWNGVAQPDLAVLLGSYADDYEKARRQASQFPGRRSSRVKTQRVVVETWGHMRDLHGRAYAPALMPQGVNIDEIK